MARLLVTGRHGFVGATLVRMIETDHALAHWQVADITERFDLRDREGTAALVATSMPDAVLHLAAESWVPDSFRDPETTLQVNLLGTLHLLQALKQVRFRGRMVYAGTGDIYGLVPADELPASEARLPVPRNPYAVSKLAAEALCRVWFVAEGMEIVLARPFNHIGPGQSDRFAMSDFARQIAQIERHRREPVVQVGDIDVTRDFTDVRDVVRAYFALLESGQAGEAYNVCSGQERSIRSLLERLVEMADVRVTLQQDASRLRRNEQRRVFGDPTKIRQATGWRATTPIDDSLASMLQYWREGKNA